MGERGAWMAEKAFGGAEEDGVVIVGRGQGWERNCGSGLARGENYLRRGILQAVCRTLG